MAAVSVTTHPQKIVGVICPQCGIYLKGDAAKNFDDPAYHKAGCTFVKKKESTRLKDHQPLPEVTSNYSQADQQRLYGYGNGIVCPYCGTTTHSNPDCTIRNAQGFANDYRMKAERATSANERNQWIRKLRIMEDNIKILAQTSQNANASTSQQPQSNTDTSSSPSTEPANDAWEYSIGNILENHDKELSYGDGYAKAYAITAPNGTEHWLLINKENEVVGKFNKVEFVDVSGTDQYVTVRDYNGQWGFYSRGGRRMCNPQYESVKKLTPIVGDNGYRGAYFDVTKRDERGILKHGLFDPNNVDLGPNGELLPNFETIPCKYDQIEMIDYVPIPSSDNDSAEGYGVLAKVKENGRWGIVDPFNGETLIPTEHSYVNTFFTRKGGRYLIVGDGTNFGAYSTKRQPMEEVIPVTVGYTLDKVRNMINERDR